MTITGPSVNGFYPVIGVGTGGANLVGFSSASFVTPDAQASAPGVPFVLPAGSAPAAVLPTAPTGSVGRVSTADIGTAGRLNVHATASASGATIGQFEHNQSIVITGPIVAGFFPVSGAGVTGRQIAGFASAQFVTPVAGTAPAPTPPPAAPPAAVAPQQAAPAAAPNLGLPAPVIVPKAAAPAAAAAAAAPVSLDDGGAGRRRLFFGSLLGSLGLFGGTVFFMNRKKKTGK